MFHRLLTTAAALAMLAVVVVVQQLEGNVLSPFLMGRAVSLHPLVVILTVTGGSYVAGLPGALFAVPCLAVVATATRYLRGDDLFPRLAQGGSAGPGASAFEVNRGLQVIGGRNAQARNAVAYLAQADAQARGRCRAVKARFAQGAHQNIALLLVEPSLQI